MNLIPIALDIDGSISLQEELKSKLAEIIDFNSLENSIRLWSNEKNLNPIRQSLIKLREKYKQPWLTFLGSGDFHHLTLLLLEALQKEFHPITLVLIDNHPDWFTQGGPFHCGNWVSGAVKLNWIDSIILIGQDSNDLQGLNYFFSPLKEISQGKIHIYPYKRKKSLIPFKQIDQILGVEKSVKHFYGTEIHYRTVQENGIAVLLKDLSTLLKNKNVYLSIDKDCLHKGFASTDWEQGLLTVNDLKICIREILRMSKIVGIDVCGEQAPKPLKGFLKNLDTNRFLNYKTLDINTVNKVNEKTNLELFKEIMSALHV